MFKPFFNRKYDPSDVGEGNDWVFWRWFDIHGQEDQAKGTAENPVYLRRLYIVRCPWFSVMLHRIFLPDPDRHRHDHPWDFLSILVRGWYEEQRGATYYIRRWFNFCKAEGSHKITMVSSKCISLVITGPKRREWGFHTPTGWVHWRDYIYGPPKKLDLSSRQPRIPVVVIQPPYPKPWSPCKGPDCDHPSHGE